MDFGGVDIFVPFEASTHLGDGHFIRIWAAFFGIKTTEFTEFVAYIGVVDVLVADEICALAVASFADDVGHVSDGGEVGVVIEPDTVFGGEALLIFDFVINVDEVADDTFRCNGHSVFSREFSLFLENSHLWLYLTLVWSQSVHGTDEGGI